MSFYKSFDKYNKCVFKDFINTFRSIDYINYPKTLETIDKLRDTFEKLITKPQELILDNHLYYIARDVYTNTIYICYKNVLVLDIDTYKEGLHNDDILQMFDDSLYAFKVYKTSNGFHAFCVSENFDYTDNATIDLMIKMKCDFFYAFYCNLRGFCVRLNRKMNEYFYMMSLPERSKAPPIYTYIGTYGRGKVRSDIEQLVEIHIDFLKKYNTYTPVA